MPDDAPLRQRLYRGDILTRPPGDASRALTRRAIALLLRALPEAEGQPAALPRLSLEPDAFFSRVQTARAALRDEPELAGLLRAVALEAGFDAPSYRVDVARLRAVPHPGHLIPEAAPASYAHRDTWYGNPAAQINLWLPLFDVGHDQSFGFYPSAFDRPVENDSGRFDYDDFMRRAGWQNYDAGPRPTYPRASETLGPPETFALEASAVLLFSAAQLHATLPNESGATRYSLDFRIVHRDDHARGRGAPDPDNHSTGSAFQDYVM